MLNKHWWNAKQDSRRDDAICESWEKMYKDRIKILNRNLDEIQQRINNNKQNGNDTIRKSFPEMLDYDN